MKHVVPICALCFSLRLSSVQAGDLVTIKDGLETNGKIVFTAGTFQAQGVGSPTTTNLQDVLEVTLSDDPFTLNYFVPGRGDQVPSTWKAQQLGAAITSGSATVSNGTFTLSDGTFPAYGTQHGKMFDNVFFIGQHWTGNGQWTARVKEIMNQNPETKAGLTLRESLDGDAAMAALGAASQGNGLVVFRGAAGKWLERVPAPLDAPIWLRMTRDHDEVISECSSDGAEWDIIGTESFTSPLANPWIGLFIGNPKGQGLDGATIDKVSLTPPPSSAQVLPPGVLLVDGTYLAGFFERLVLDSANPDAPGIFVFDGKPLPIPASKVAAVVMLPIQRSQIADMAARVGTLMQNGDIIDGDFSSISSMEVVVSSVLLGITNYNRSEVRGCFLRPVRYQLADYEVRGRDGSIVNASGVSTDGTTTQISDTSGMTLNVAADDVAQIRAGSSQVQNLAIVAWKATLPKAPAARPAPAAPSVAPADSTSAVPAANAMPAPAPAPDLPAAPAVQTWQGPNEEQIIAVPTGGAVEFPLDGRFRALGVRVALSPDSPPGSTATIRIVANGQTLLSTPAFQAGDQPRYLQFSLPNLRKVTLQADSIVTNAKLLFIDPVAIRAK